MARVWCGRVQQIRVCHPDPSTGALGAPAKITDEQPLEISFLSATRAVIHTAYPGSIGGCTTVDMVAGTHYVQFRGPYFALVYLRLFVVLSLTLGAG